MSSGRDPIASPPGSATLARLQRADQRAEHAHRRPELPDRGEVGVVLGLVGRGDRGPSSPSSSTVAPRPRSTSAISGTSRMSGQLVIVRGALGQQRWPPSASARCSWRRPTATSPDNRLPPVTTKRSLTRVSVAAARARVSDSRRSARYGLTMAVHLTRIYTRTGDDGTTGLSDFSPGVQERPAARSAYADCDETNAAIGVAVALGDPDERLRAVLRQIQNDLFDAGADLSTPVVENPEYPPLRITEDYIDRLEALVRRVQRAAAGTEFVHPARRHRRCRRCCTSPARWPAAPSARRGSRSTPTATRSACCRPVPQPAVGPAVHPVAGGQSRTATCCGSRAAGRSAKTRRRRAAAAQTALRRGPRRRPRLEPGQECRQRSAVQCHLVTAADAPAGVAAVRAPRSRRS